MTRRHLVLPALTSSAYNEYGKMSVSGLCSAQRRRAGDLLGLAPASELRAAPQMLWHHCGILPYRISLEKSSHLPYFSTLLPTLFFLLLLPTLIGSKCS